MRLCLRLHPGASSEKIIQCPDHSLAVYVTKRPHQGQANQALMELLARHFAVAKSRIKIIRGQKSRDKTVEIV